MSWMRWLAMLADLTSWKTALGFMKHWTPRMVKAFFSSVGLEPSDRKALIGDFFRRRLLTEVFEAIRPGLTKVVAENVDSPVDDRYISLYHDSLLEVDLDGPEYDERFASAPLYRWRPTVSAIQLTNERIKACEEYPIELNGIDLKAISEDFYSYRINEPYVREDENGDLRFDFRTVDGLIDRDEWLVKDPGMALALSRDTRFFFEGIKDADFWRFYAVAEPGLYRPRIMYRAFRNPTRRNVETYSEQRGIGYGDPWSWFVAPYDSYHPSDLAAGRRFPVSFWWFEQFFERCAGCRKHA